MIRSFFALVILVVLSSCADPKYVQEVNPTDQGKEKLSLNCPNRFPKSGICLSFKWEIRPTETVPGQLVMRLFTVDEFDGFPDYVAEQTQIKVKLWMNSMGHGSAPVLLERIKPGTYRASKMYFIMPGEWEIKFQILENGTVADELAINYNI